ncbi:MAG: uncharacterized protein A8A55_1376 [Amphiamblys sp. WSBS2006]|nr:MAG: uncharacterized protein A8A55_1376 [Amphiamblys sp. WSBS2006]
MKMEPEKYFLEGKRGRWTAYEVEILRRAIIYYGVGNPKKIMQHGCLLTKRPPQITTKTQNLMGQQSLAEFVGLHVDVTRVGKDNAKLKNVLRKGKKIINTSKRLKGDALKEKREENEDKYEIGEEERERIILPNKAVYEEVKKAMLLLELYVKKKEEAKLFIVKLNSLL